MAALPLRLQDNMRELHFERVQRLKREKSNTLFYKPTCHEASPAIWYQDSIATMGASQDAGRGGLPSSSSKKTDWYLWQSMREMDYRRHMAHDAMVTAGLYSHSSSARFNLFSRYSTSTEEDIEARSIRSKYTPQSTGAKTRPCVVHSVEDMETTHEEPNVHERQFRRRGSSMISAMRWHVRRSIQKMSRVFKKQPSYQGHTGTYEAFVAT
ncbi:hypothetical protein BDV26DRAFT_256326 [Aspergillus bertholletiae]|uniref:Uncharacterized protein n=1 Tax=Aspergillus bertholletiae TaxID=1226010 RepID=A0A5N7BGW8_9EURO|nr:hypothetical protein BDV26DRAFT_256326 [Aspergillus bertholletiae]